MFFRKKNEIGTVFLKEESEAAEFISKLRELLPQAEGEVEKRLERELRLAEYGEAGEKNIAFELKNSGLDLYVLHDIYIETGDLSAQIDYLVVGRKRVYVIECKNLIGNIEIDSKGNFVRTYELHGKPIREGIYSPVTQNNRHLQVIKELGKSTKRNLQDRKIFESLFDKVYTSVIVLANPKTCLNDRYAKKEIKDQIIRADQLIAYIKKMELSNEAPFGNKEMLDIAQSFLKHHCKKDSDYASRYQEIVTAVEQKTLMDAAKDENQVSESQSKIRDQESLAAKLKAYRLEQCRKEQIKPYYIFNDAQMRDLIEKDPKTSEELLLVSGFGPVKTQKYGNDLLKILQDFRSK